MRNLLFRAKAINRDKGYHRTNYKNGDWVYGLITRLYDERFENLPAKMADVTGVTGIEVDYKTIGQYTGLTDKNGTKIFEGDIVDILRENEEIGAIKWGESEAMFMISADGFITDFDHYWGKELEVIGNIFDNPELLKGVGE